MLIISKPDLSKRDGLIIALLQHAKPIICIRFALFRFLPAFVSMVVMLFPPLGHSNTKLPPLGNSAEGDRVMLREVSDDYIHRGTKAPTALAAKEIAGDVWRFVQQSRRLQIPQHKAIAYYQEQYQREAIYITRMLERASPFIGYVVEELDKRYLPLELALLPVIESGYQPDVQSHQKALGIWQIVPATAADVGIVHTPWFDGRSDIRQSTHAAADYLSYLNAQFNGDWSLTLAAYNAGLGRVRSAIKRNEEDGLPTDFWSLSLPSETRNYVPKFLALVAVLRQNAGTGVELPTVPRGSAFDLVNAGRRVSLDRLATVTGLDEDTLRLLNAGLVHGATPPNGPHEVYVPQGIGQPLVDLLKRNNSLTLFSWPDTHLVEKGETLSSIALRYKISLPQLKQINSLDSDFIRSGQTLKVRKLSGAHTGFVYVVTVGDTLTEIAERFSINVSAILDENGQPLGSDVIHPGERLSLLTDVEIR